MIGPAYLLYGLLLPFWFASVRLAAAATPRQPTAVLIVEAGDRDAATSRITTTPTTTSDRFSQAPAGMPSVAPPAR